MKHQEYKFETQIKEVETHPRKISRGSGDNDDLHVVWFAREIVDRSGLPIFFLFLEGIVGLLQPTGLRGNCGKSLTLNKSQSNHSLDWRELAFL